MIEFLTAFILWITALAPASIIASLTAQRNPKKAGFMMQIAILLISLILMEILGDAEKFGLVWRFEYILPAFFLGFGIFSCINLFEGKSSEPIPEFMPEGLPLRLLLLLFLAPLSEETLNRGLVEGYLLAYHFQSAVVFSAFLFAVPHLKAFEGMKNKERVVIFGSAFLLGLLAGYLFALAGSILPAFILHSSANLAGVLSLRETQGYK